MVDGVFGLAVKCSGKLLMSLEQWVDKVWPYVAMKWSKGKSGRRDSKELTSVPLGARGVGLFSMPC